MTSIKFFSIDDNIDELLFNIGFEGWDYTIPGEDYFDRESITNVVFDPWGTPRTVSHCMHKLSDNLVFGDYEQIWSARSLDVFNVLYNKYGPAYLGFDPKETGNYLFKKQDYTFKPKKDKSVTR